MQNDSSDVHPLNALLPRLVTESGIVILVKPLPANADSPIVVTLLGMLFNDSQ